MCSFIIIIHTQDNEYYLARQQYVLYFNLLSVSNFFGDGIVRSSQGCPNNNELDPHVNMY